MSEAPNAGPADRELIALAVVVAVSFWSDESLDVWLDRARGLERRATPGLTRHAPVFEALWRTADGRADAAAASRARRDLAAALHRFFAREIGSAGA